jgi:hypothetical protein
MISNPLFDIVNEKILLLNNGHLRRRKLHKKVTHTRFYAKYKGSLSLATRPLG